MLAPLVESGQIRTPFTPQHCTANSHMFYLLAADLAERTALVEHLRQAGILAVFHYVPLHSSPFAKSLGVQQADLPVTDDTSSRLLRLPMYYDLSDRDVTEVAEAVLAFYKTGAAYSYALRSHISGASYGVKELDHRTLHFQAKSGVYGIRKGRWRTLGSILAEYLRRAFSRMVEPARLLTVLSPVSCQRICSTKDRRASP